MKTAGSGITNKENNRQRDIKQRKKQATRYQTEKTTDNGCQTKKTTGNEILNKENNRQWDIKQ